MFGRRHPVPDDDARTFTQEFGKGDGPDDEDLLPTKPVAPGGTWTPNLEKALPLMAKELPFDLAKTGNAANGKLTAVYPKDGQRYGKFELNFSLKPISSKEGENLMALKPGCTVTLQMKVDACIDGTSNAGTMTNTMTANLDYDIPGKTLKKQIEGKTVLTITPVKK